MEDDIMVTTVTPPEYASSRPVAQTVANQLPSRLDGQAVHVDCHAVEAATPAFVDELIRQIVIERHAAELSFVGVPTRTVRFVKRSARLRNVEDQVRVDTRQLTK